MSDEPMPWRYVAALPAVAVCFVAVARLIHLTGIGFLLGALFVACGVGLVIERRTRG